jgi:hypothetical protein
MRKEPATVRFAVIIFAVLAMILGPFSGPASAHAAHSAGIGLAATAGADCEHGPHLDAEKPIPAQDHCRDGSDACMDVNGCRHIGCFAGGAGPSAVVHTIHAYSVAVPLTDFARPEGLDVAPPLDPPRRRA